MTQRTARPLIIGIPVILAVMTAGVLILNIPSGDLIGLYAGQMLTYGFLTTFVLFFGVWLRETELSPAHVIGMVAFLSLPAEAVPVMLWAVFLGGVVGAGVQRLRRRPPRRNPLYMAARVTLSFFATTQVYIAANGTLPLQSQAWGADWMEALPLVIYVLVYVTLYFSIVVLELYATGHQIDQIIRGNLSLILVTMLLPVPFAVLSAEVLLGSAGLVAAISLIGLALIVLGLHALSRSERQLHRQLNELQTLSVVTRTVRSHLELDALLKTIYLQVAHLLNIENFTVALFDPHRQRMEFPLVMRRRREEQGNHELRERLYNNDLIDHVHKSGLALLISRDVPQQAQAMGLEPPNELMYSWLGIPLLAGGNNMGVIAVSSEHPDQHFDENDLRLMHIVAASASIAIENAQLYQQQTDRLDQMVTLNNVTALLSGTLSPDTVLDTVISSASAITQANAVAVYLFWDDAGANLPLVRSAGFSDNFIKNPPKPISQTHGKSNAHLRLPIAIGNMLEDERTTDIAVQMAAENKLSLVELPLLVGETGLGVVVLYFNELQSFDGEQLELFRTFATQAAQAIKNARTYTSTDEALRRSVDQLFALAEIGRQLTSTIDLKRICELVLSGATEATHVDVGMVALYDETEGRLQVMAQTGYPNGDLAPDRGINKRVYETGRIQRQNDVSKDPDYANLVESTRSQLSVPILRVHDVLGFVTLESPQIAGFSSEDSHFVSQIANQAVIAIDNARLFQRITEGRDRLQVILDTMEEGIILIDSRGKIALANPRIDMIGLEPDALVNQPVRSLLAGSDLAEKMGFKSAEAVETLVSRIGVTAERWLTYGYEPQTFPARGDNGSLFVQRYIIPVPDENDQTMGVMLVFYDKTEEQELDRAREELSRMIVHDLRSPLTAVNTSLKLLHEFVPPEAEFKTLVTTTTDASRRAIRKLLSRVDSLLDIAKMQSGRLSVDTDVHDLHDLVNNVTVDLTPLARELEIDLIPDIDGDVPLLDIDGDKVERLLTNLVDNALKYSPMDSDIRIRARLEPEDDNQWVRVEVVDNGPGVPDDYKKTLFNSYVQVEGRQRVRRGVGLGLTFCKLVAEAHGGDIWIEDNPSGGSVFAFTLPVVKMGILPED